MDVGTTDGIGGTRGSHDANLQETTSFFVRSFVRSFVLMDGSMIYVLIIIFGFHKRTVQK